MHIGSHQTVGIAVTLLMMTGTTWEQDKPICDSQGKVKTREMVEGRVSKMDQNQGKLTVRASDGEEIQFRASKETLQDFKVGDPIKAKLREAPNCPEK